MSDLALVFPRLTSALLNRFRQSFAKHDFGFLSGRVLSQMAVFSSLSPVPSLPRYTGPHTVGSQDVEIPVSELTGSQSPPGSQLPTVNFRTFYPCKPPQKTQNVHWLPEPQGEYIKALYRFMSAKPWLASLLSWLPLLRLIQYTTIPVSQDADLLEPTITNKRWPVMVFSHGLGGSKNTYSHICGSLASHGMVVVAPDHRDGSCPISFIKEPGNDRLKSVDYISLPHQPLPEVEEGRNEQLKIRCWELSNVHDALLKLDAGKSLTNLQASKEPSRLSIFESKLDVKRPGKICWAGHSFGASTMVQFLKSVYHDGSVLFKSPSSNLKQQITPASPLSLLDLWAMPLSGSSTSTLFNQPLPAYCGSPSSMPLAILSKGFYNWSTNLQYTLQAICAPSAEASEKPYIFYPISSAHLSQSDFGLLYPWLTKKVMKAEEPERTLKLNIRAILEQLRWSGIEVASTSALDMEVEKEQEVDVQVNGLAVGHDHRILEANGDVRGWVSVDANKERKRLGLSGGQSQKEEPQSPGEAVMKNEVMQP